MAFKGKGGLSFAEAARARSVIPEDHRPEGSINAELHALPVLRFYGRALRGVPVLLPRCGLVVVPHRFDYSDDGAGAIVVMGSETYPRGGYDVDVSEWELQRAQRLCLGPDVMSVPYHPEDGKGCVVHFSASRAVAADGTSVRVWTQTDAELGWS